MISKIINILLIISILCLSWNAYVLYKQIQIVKQKIPLQISHNKEKVLYKIVKKGITLNNINCDNVLIRAFTIKNSSLREANYKKIQERYGCLIIVEEPSILEIKFLT